MEVFAEKTSKDEPAANHFCGLIYIVRSIYMFIFQQMDALDQSEELTELGRHLADLPVDPHLGKMVLNSIVLKCLDPVLTIVCSLSYKDPCKY